MAGQPGETIGVVPVDCFEPQYRRYLLTQVGTVRVNAQVAARRDKIHDAGHNPPSHPDVNLHVESFMAYDNAYNGHDSK